MKSFEVELKTELKVTFEDPIKAFNYFITGDWSDYFWRLEDLSEVASTLSLHFSTEAPYWNREENWDERSAEGWGCFKKVTESKWETYNEKYIEECGKIIIEEVSELYEEFVTELD